MADELMPQTVDAIAYLDEHSDLATVFCTIAPFLLDHRAYKEPKHEPSNPLRDFVHEGTLISKPIQLLLRQSDVSSRILHDGRFGPSAFGLPVPTPTPEDKPKYDVCISYAIEDHDIALRLANQLKRKYRLKVFFDEFEQHKLTGHQLTEMLYDIYARDSLLCVTLFSKAYAGKDWARHELRAARDRAIRTRGRPYIFPVCLEKGAMPEDFAEVAYWTFQPGTEAKLAREINERIFDWVRENMISLEEITKIVNRDFIRSAVLDGFKKGMKEAEDSEYVQALWVLGLLAAVSKGELVRSVNALLDYVVTAVESLSKYMERDGSFKVFGTARVSRWLEPDGPLLLSLDGWSPLIKELADARDKRLNKELEERRGQDDNDN
jgi:hypothetical protein